MKPINLIPQRLRDAALIRTRRRRWVAAGTVYSLVLVMVCAGLRLAGGRESTRLSGDGGRLAERLASAESRLEKLRADVQDVRRRKDAADTVGVHPDWSVLLAALAEMREQDIVLHSIDLRTVEPEVIAAQPKADGSKAPVRRGAPESYHVDVRGYGLSHGDVVRFVRRLEERGPLLDVRLKESRAQPYLGVPAVAFSAQFRLADGQARNASATATEQPPRAQVETAP